MAAIKHILFPFDFSVQGVQAIPFVRALATRLEAKVTVLGVAPPAWQAIPAGMPPLTGDTQPEWIGALQEHLNMRVRPEFDGLKVEALADAGDPALRIGAIADEMHADLIMMPTHGLGKFRAWLIGSVTAKVLHDVHCPVWTAAHAAEQRSPQVPRRILCAVDGGVSSVEVLKWGAAFSGAVGAQLTALHVVSSISDWPALSSEQNLQDRLRHEAQTRLDHIRRAAGVNAPLHVAVGDITEMVTEHAREEDADLVVIGRGTVCESFGRFRTHAFAIVQRSPCPVVSI